MSPLPPYDGMDPSPPADGPTLYNWKIDYANGLRSSFKQNDLLAQIAVEVIRTRRKSITGSASKPAPSQAYVISQLKRPEEVALLRKVYGRQFILISAYGSEADRKARLVSKLRAHVSTNTSRVRTRVSGK